jgi:dynactin complex subunit
MNGERYIGKFLLFNSLIGNLKYLGPLDVQSEKGIWCGIELDRSCNMLIHLYLVGNHNGTLKGKRYFECQEAHGIFVKLDKVIPMHAKTRSFTKVMSALFMHLEKFNV